MDRGDLGSTARFVAGIVACSLAFAPGAVRGAGELTSWPLEIDTSEGLVVIYEPQPETLEGDVLAGRAAISMTPTGESEPIFGAITFVANLDIDRSTRVALIENATVTGIRFADKDEGRAERIAGELEESVPEWELRLGLDNLVASLEPADGEGDAHGFKNDAPEILISHEPAVLLVYDGQPQLRDLEGTTLREVVNTSFIVLYDDESKKFWMTDGRTWFSSPDATRAWAPASSEPPRAVLSAMEKGDRERELPAISDDEYQVPKILVATKPTELVVIDGEPQMTPLKGTDLLYVENTESQILFEVDEQEHYLLLSGRWYRAKNLQGPWSFVRNDKLPESFLGIPPESVKGALRAHVAGTSEARDAVVDAYIPQTAAIRRGDATLTVEFDGSPSFERIPGTKVDYAVNSATTVLRIKKDYYAVSDGVWYVADGPLGPWFVSDVRPDEVDDIPASSPAYNVRYVYIYEATPEIVYVGYLPGYVGCYPAYGSVVYGTGWYYDPWYGPSYYYPRPWTWGYCPSYNPWTGGWGYGTSWSSGFYNVNWWWGSAWRPAYCHWGGWWGAGGYVPYWHNWGYTGPVVIDRPAYLSSSKYKSPPPGASGSRVRPSKLPASVYQRPSVKSAVESRPAVTRPSPRLAGKELVKPVTKPASLTGGKPLVRPTPKPRPSKRPNDVYADKDGAVYRDKEGTWTEPTKEGWKPTSKPLRPTSSRGSGWTKPEPSPTEAGKTPSVRPAPSQDSPKLKAPTPSTVEQSKSAREKTQRKAK